MSHLKPRYFIYAATLTPLLLAGCTAEPNSYYHSGYDGSTPVKVYDQTTTVTPGGSYYDSATHSTLTVGPTTTTTSTVGPANVTYQDDEGNWHTTYDTN